MMISLEQINLKLEKILSEERYQHSWQVSKLAEEIAEYYHVSSKKAKIVGLIHDCAKDYSYVQLQKLMDQYNIRLNKIEKHIPGIWHAYVGAEMARDIFRISEQEMIDAIKYHSTASRHLSCLGKILYIADKIEPGRNIENIHKVRRIVWQDIDEALLGLLNQELKQLISRNLLIHPSTLQARNEILYNKIRFLNGKNRKT